jgi:hypothetical protein
MKNHMLSNSNKVEEQIMIHIIKLTHYQISMILEYMPNMIISLVKLQRNGLKILVKQEIVEEVYLI